MHTNT